MVKVAKIPNAIKNSTLSLENSYVIKVFIQLQHSIQQHNDLPIRKAIACNIIISSIIRITSVEWPVIASNWWLISVFHLSEARRLLFERQNHTEEPQKRSDEWLVKSD